MGKLDRAIKAVASLSDEEKNELFSMINGGDDDTDTPEPVEPSSDTKPVDTTKEGENTTPQDKSTDTDNNVVKNDATPVEEPAEPVVEPTAPTVADTQGTPNAISIDDVVTLDMLNDKIAPLFARIEASDKEIANLREINSALRDKYEKNDFGYTGNVKPLSGETNAGSLPSFADYTKTSQGE